jgi:uncharacterized protein
VQAIRQFDWIQVVPDAVLLEVFYVVGQRINYRIAVSTLESIISRSFQIMEITNADRIRMVEIMRRYESAQFDFVDWAIMAMSERLNITRVATFDHRNFSIFRPNHCHVLELVP